MIGPKGKPHSGTASSLRLRIMLNLEGAFSGQMLAMRIKSQPCCTYARARERIYGLPRACCDYLEGSLSRGFCRRSEHVYPR